LVANKLERISCAAAMARSEPAAAPPNAGARPSSSIQMQDVFSRCPECQPDTDLRAARGQYARCYGRAVINCLKRTDNESRNRKVRMCK